jgi:DNA repair exonuclease SbcCD nuclease subunit
MRKQLQENATKTYSYEEKLSIFRTHCKDRPFLIPGNHDPFTEVQIKSDILKKPQSLFINGGDLVEFTSEEMNRARKDVNKLLPEMGFVRKSFYRQPLSMKM